MPIWAARSWNCSDKRDQYRISRYFSLDHIVGLKAKNELDQHMKITLKLYAKLGQYLPENASKNEATIEIADGLDIEQTLDHYCVPTDQRHIVMVNGVHIMREKRATTILSESDSLAVWPPSTG